MADTNNEEIEITPELEEDYRITQARLFLLRQAHTKILEQINWEYEAFFQRNPHLRN